MSPAIKLARILTNTQDWLVSRTFAAKPLLRMALSTPAYRIQSIDLIKGLVMVVMALDHVRDFFHYPAFFTDPLDLDHSSPAIFFTRWITHFCAPTFSLLAGASAWFVGKRKSKGQLSKFLLTRGLWLIFIEVVVIDFAWLFDPGFHIIILATIWSLGVSMIALAGLVQLPRWLHVALCVLFVAGHNALDNVHYEGMGWAMLHEGNFFSLWPEHGLFTAYPVIPWIGIMGLGYQLGYLYSEKYTMLQRRSILLRLSAAAFVLWVWLDWTSLYGDPHPRELTGDAMRQLLSFLKREKYPPSLQYILMTIGPMMAVLAWAETWPTRFTAWLGTFGRVPFFYFILHIYLIHVLALIWGYYSGFGWKMWGIKKWIDADDSFDGFGFPLIGVYAIWIAVVVALYPLCRWFDVYKQTHRHQWWLSYL